MMETIEEIIMKFKFAIYLCEFSHAVIQQFSALPQTPDTSNMRKIITALLIQEAPCRTE